MEKKELTTVLFVLLMWRGTVSGQCDEFKVFSYHASCITYSSANDSMWKKHTPENNATSYSSKNIIRLEKGCTARMSCKNAEVILPGPLQIRGDSILALLNKQSGNVQKHSTTFFKIIEDNWSHHEKCTQILRTIKGDGSPLQFPVDSELLYTKTIVFTWTKPARSSQFQIYGLTPKEYKLLVDTTLVDNEIKITVRSLSHQHFTAFAWGVNQQNEYNVFLFPDKGKTENIALNYKNIKTLRKIDIIGYYLVKAAFEEQMNMHTLAYHTFTEGIHRYPDSEVLKNSYQAFLFANRLNPIIK